ncbi:hypothetical protein [Tenacibaculum jejuense]|uniref:Uncharacterized protein n=1 Tax=Tenacibaculum jejuense TaxID=584609 RepID=A0A238U5X1_9FLAO|nr:hypothetical protein [Tenacibaculum jejuense]SNR14537.1 protein of unknown function [Tenacibaculum jejuense]
MKNNFLNKVKGAILLSKEEAKTISGGYSGTYDYSCFFVCCPSSVPRTHGVINANGCTRDRRYKYYAPQFASNYCVACN